MYVRTPKRYRGRQRRRPFSCQRYLLWLILIAFIVLGVGIYQNRKLIEPTVNRIAMGIMQEMEASAATAAAPLPTPTLDPALNLVSGHNAWERGDVSNALLAYKQIMGSLPNDVPVHERMTIGLITRGDEEEGLVYAENTVTADPFDSDAWATRAFALAWEDQYTAAIASAYQALDINPDNARAMAFLAYAYWGSDKGELANSRAEQAISMDGERFEGYWVRGLIRENTLFDFVGAATDYETAYDYALEQNPAVAGVIATGIARMRLNGNVAGAVDILEQARAIDPDNTTMLYWLGRIQFVNRGDYAQAQSPLADCVRVDSEDYDCLYYLGRTLDRLGDQAGALDAFLGAIDAGSPSARTYWWTANMHIALGSCSDATEFLEIGYRMVAPGDLPAVDEGTSDLLDDAFPALMSTCRITVGPVRATNPEPTPEATEETEATSDEG